MCNYEIALVVHSHLKLIFLDVQLEIARTQNAFAHTSTKREMCPEKTLDMTSSDIWTLIRHGADI